MYGSILVVFFGVKHGARNARRDCITKTLSTFNETAVTTTKNS